MADGNLKFKKSNFALTLTPSVNDTAAPTTISELKPGKTLWNTTSKLPAFVAPDVCIQLCPALDRAWP